MPFLRNCWYVAGWSHELVGGGLVHRKLLDEQVLLYRDSQGAAHAISNVCPHRFAPLHLGKVVGDTIECPYHGLRFNAQGRCVYNPDGDGKVPAGARLQVYPVAETLGAIWFWPGDPEKADPAKLPDLPYMDSPDYQPVRGYLHVRANYQFITDNLMDVSHLTTLHPDTLACEAITRAKTKLIKDPDGTIWANRYSEATPPAPMFAEMWQATKGTTAGVLDQWVEGGWVAPSIIRNTVGITAPGASRDEGVEIRNAHLLTPETETTSHYFWCVSRQFERNNPFLDQMLLDRTNHIFISEDETMLHAVQEAVADREFWSLSPALLAADVGAVEVRRTLSKLIAAEAAA